MTRILVVDDHPLFRLALTQAIRNLVTEANVAEAASLADARAALAATPDTDLVLLDLHMPDSHGLMGLAALRGEFPAVAVVMISAHADPAVIRRALSFGAAGFIPKSSDLKELRGARAAGLAGEDYGPPAARAQVSALAPARDDRAQLLRTE